MIDRQLYLLSPYRLPTNHQIYLNDDEMASWLNGFLALWHPALIHHAPAPPKVDSSYDHDFPVAGDVFAIPESPTLFQPDDWSFRVEQVGAIRFRASPDREATLADLKQAIESAPAFADETTRAFLQLPPEQIRPFLALGFGYIMIESLFEAMDHEHLLAVEEFWDHLRKAARALIHPSPEPVEGGPADQVEHHLHEAAARLLSAREVLYPVTVYLLDLAIIDEQRLEVALPGAFDQGFPLNILATGSALRKLAEEQPDRLNQWKAKLHSEQQPPLLEIVSGVHSEREDALLPLESQWWNLRRGRAIAKELLDTDVNVYARKRSAFHPQTPLFLHATGCRQALMITFDNSVIPNHRAVVVNWPSPDGKSINAFSRVPLPSHQPQTFFNLVYSLHQAITQDSAPTLALAHQGQPPFPCYDDWLLLSRYGPILGQWTTFTKYFDDAMAGDYTGPANADDFFADYLEERVNQHRPDPVSAFPRHARIRRRLDAVWTFAGILRGLQSTPPTDDDLASVRQLTSIENQLEEAGLNDAGDRESSPQDISLTLLEQTFAVRIAERLQSRAADNQPGYLLLNPCAFTRRVALELDEVKSPIPIELPLKAGQFDPDRARLVVEVPALGFAWIPKVGKSGTPAPKARMRLADGTTVRNEFFEADVDPESGGLRAFRDVKTRRNRIAAQLVFNPGSRTVARSVTITNNGAALGEIVAEGDLFNEQNDLLAAFKIRYRAWQGRPVLDVRIEMDVKHPPTGYPWHAYYGWRFAWGNDRASLIRGVHSTANQTNHTRPQSPDYLEIREGRQNFLLFPGGLPFHQRHGTRMLDVILIPEGEQAKVFEIALAVDRELPAQPAIGMISPIAVLPTTKGPPHIGPSGWLFHLDMPNLMLTSIRPVEENARAMIVTMLETSGFAGSAELRCVRNPVRACVVDHTDTPGMDFPIEGDAVKIDYIGNDLIRLRVDFE